MRKLLGRYPNNNQLSSTRANQLNYDLILRGERLRTHRTHSRTIHRQLPRSELNTTRIVSYFAGVCSSNNNSDDIDIDLWGEWNRIQFNFALQLSVWPELTKPLWVETPRGDPMSAHVRRVRLFLLIHVSFVNKLVSIIQTGWIE